MSIAFKGVRTLRRQGFTVLLTVAALCILAIISLSQAVTRDLRLLETSNSDNVQWTLAQAEVEFIWRGGRPQSSAKASGCQPVCGRSFSWPT
jgi:chromosome segregation and condensation protein ScpB